MTKSEITQKLLDKSQQLPVEVLQEVLDFMEFVATKRKPFSNADNDAWKQDFLSVSQWHITEQEVAVRSWQIETF